MSKKNQLAKNELAPAMEIPDGKGSGYKMKDKHFNKVKTYIEKSTNIQKEVDADWRTIIVGRTEITAFKNQELTEKQFKVFDVEAKEYWLQKLN
jgi:hypothetical protein